jgi:hypothetical protein
MTIPNTNETIGSVDAEIGAANRNSTLGALNGYIKPAQRPASPRLSAFRGMSYYQRNQDGNCNNANINNCDCNCGSGARAINCYATANCQNVNCANCDTQKWLQTGTNCACTYNCNSNQNCFSYNCNCSKIICTKLHELGLLPTDIFEADQEFGGWLIENHPDVYNGYVAWAQIVVDWMEGNGPNVLPGMEETRRNEILKQWAIKWSKDIATPWAEHIAGKQTLTGKFLYWTGVPICKTIGVWQRVFGKNNKKAGFIKGVALINIFVLFKLVVEFGRFIESISVTRKTA